jgi:hypothetical protein
MILHIVHASQATACAQGGGVNALVGVAISASLLPPIVNCGICCAFAIIGPALFDCLGSAHHNTFGTYDPKRWVPTPVNGSTFYIETHVQEACERRT